MNKGIQNKSASKVRFWHLVKFVFLSIVFACGIIGMASTRPPGPIEIKPVYILGFAEHGSDRIRVRWSEDGQTWGDGDFPNHTTSVGVGATSSAAGLLNIMFWADSSNTLQALWGLGPAIWDTRPGGPSLTQQVLSAPSAAYAGDSLYLLAYRTTGDAVAVRVLNSNTRRWLTTSLAPAHPSNSSVRGSPTIIILRGKVLLAWHRSGTCEIALGDVQIVTVGEEKVPVINWTNIYTLSLSESGFGNPRSDPTLTHDGDRFYLGFIRRTTGEPLQADWLFIYSSSDGISWNLQKTKPGVILYADVNIAARSDGSLLVALVAPGTTIPKREVYKLAGGSWTQLDADTVFGWVPGTKPFTLISNKP